MTILSEFMNPFSGSSPAANGDSTSNTTSGFASNETGTRRQYAWASQSLLGIPFHVHQEANQRALAVMGAASKDINVINSATVHIDSPQYQDAWWAHIHAMSAPYESAESAAWRADDFVREKFKAAWEYKAKGDLKRSLFEFGLALHTLQDSTSPSHRNFPTWSGEEDALARVRHAWSESTYPGDNSDLYRITQQAYKWYLSGKLPDEPLFGPNRSR